MTETPAARIPKIEFRDAGRTTRHGYWTAWIDGTQIGTVTLDVAPGKWRVSVFTDPMHEEAVQEAVYPNGDIPWTAPFEDVKSAVRRGYAEHLRLMAGSVNSLTAVDGQWRIVPNTEEQQ